MATTRLMRHNIVADLHATWFVKRSRLDVMCGDDMLADVSGVTTLRQAQRELRKVLGKVSESVDIRFV